MSIDKALSFGKVASPEVKAKNNPNSVSVRPLASLIARIPEKEGHSAATHNKERQPYGIACSGCLGVEGHEEGIGWAVETRKSQLTL